MPGDDAELARYQLFRSAEQDLFSFADGFAADRRGRARDVGDVLIADLGVRQGCLGPWQLGQAAGNAQPLRRGRSGHAAIGAHPGNRRGVSF